ncbi:proline-rich receptor-like protein kinase PERK2, partial [Formica exsecta]|uniref:proline-rich receptor-like protein kinase PERK2 n=1 Tax=Formica exsecta TaxID=72781 RepID=UPI00114369DF
RKVALKTLDHDTAPVAEKPCKTPRIESIISLPTVAEIALRRKTRPTPLHFTSAKRRRVGVHPPPTSGARSPPSTGARSPPATGARSPPGSKARSPPAAGARPPPTTGAQSPPATSAPSPPITGAQSPPVTGARSPINLGTVDLTLGASPPSAKDKPSAPGALLPRKKRSKDRLQALFGASPPKPITGHSGSKAKRDRPITPDIKRPRSITPPIPWYPPPLVSPLRRTPIKRDSTTQTSPRKTGIDAATQTKRRGGRARKVLVNNNYQTVNRNCNKENRWHECKTGMERTE